jgi:hypothetical protein
MRCAQHLATAGDLARHDSAARAGPARAHLSRPDRGALNRYRSQSEPAITVQNVSAADGSNAIVGNVTQHRNVNVSAKGSASAARNTKEASDARRQRDSAEATRGAAV